MQSFGKQILTPALWAVTLAFAVALGARAGTNGSGGGAPYPTRYIQGCLVTYASATTADVSSGSWRDSIDTYDVRGFSAVSGVSATTAGAGGIDQKVISQTGSSASPTITASADITGNFNSATLTGTVSTAAATLTGSGTKFTTELAVGDVVFVSGKGGSRVTAVTSDTTATLVAALPGGDAGAGSTATRYDTPTIWIGSTASDKRLVNTISSTGTAIVVDVVPGAISTLAAGQTLTIGVAPNLASEATVNYWLYMWLRSGTSGTTAAWSTQRNTPYSITGYTTAIRRCASVPMIGGNATPVIEYAFQREVSSFVRDTFYEDATNVHNTRVLSNGTQTSWTQVFTNAVVPPTARQAYLYCDMTSNTLTQSLSIREHGLGSTATSRIPIVFNVSTSSGGGSSVPLLQGIDSTQSFDYTIMGSGSAYIDVFGFRDSL